MKENETIEFKKSTSELKEAIVSIVSILNKNKKGELYFGLDNDGGLINQKFSEKTLRDISQAIANHIEPKIYPKIQLENNIIKVSFEGKEVPYFAYGRAFIRVADEDKRLYIVDFHIIIHAKFILSITVWPFYSSFFSTFVVPSSPSYLTASISSSCFSIVFG